MDKALLLAAWLYGVSVGVVLTVLVLLLISQLWYQYKKSNTPNFLYYQAKWLRQEVYLFRKQYQTSPASATEVVRRLGSWVAVIFILGALAPLWAALTAFIAVVLFEVNIYLASKTLDDTIGPVRISLY